MTTFSPDTAITYMLFSSEKIDATKTRSLKNTGLMPQWELPVRLFRYIVIRRHGRCGLARESEEQDGQADRHEHRRPYDGRPNRDASRKQPDQFQLHPLLRAAKVIAST